MKHTPINRKVKILVEGNTWNQVKNQCAYHFLNKVISQTWQQIHGQTGNRVYDQVWEDS